MSLISSVTQTILKRGVRQEAKAVEKAAVKATEDQFLRSSAGLLEKHGLTTPASMGAADAQALAKYLEAADGRYDKADVKAALTTLLGLGKTDARALVLGAEKKLFVERGVAQADFQALVKRGFGPEQLEGLRRFADGHASSQGGKYLTLLAKAGGSADVAAARGLMARAIAQDFGLVVPKAVDEKAIVSILRDIGTEAPRDAATIVAAANEAMARGVTDYYALNTAATKKLLGEIGVAPAQLAKLDVPVAALKAALPELAPAAARAEQLRLLRDRLRVLPPADREAALNAITAGRATLLSFDQALGRHLDGQLAALMGGNAALTAELTTGMAIQQRANFVSDLRGLPADAREAVFKGLSGDAPAQAKQVVDRLAARAESRYGVVVHRTAGHSPIQNGADNTVLDWSAQAAIELNVGLEHLTGGKRLKTMEGATFVHMAYQEQPLSAIAASQEQALGTLYKPGAGRYRPGQSGLTGKEYRGMGYRTTVGDREFVAFYDNALKMDNSHRPAGISRGIGTIVHESAHVVQLGGDAEAKTVRDWSRISKWREADRSVADGRYGKSAEAVDYYKDPAVRLGVRKDVVSQYGATDPVEDFAEYARVFALDPASALAVSKPKFAYTNKQFENRFTRAQIEALASLAK